MRKRWLVFALLVGALAFTAAGCGGDDDGGGGAEGSEDVTGEISTMGTWAGDPSRSRSRRSSQASTSCTRT